jgi:hypothetical protein
MLLALFLTVDQKQKEQQGSLNLQLSIKFLAFIALFQAVNFMVSTTKLFALVSGNTPTYYTR